MMASHEYTHHCLVMAVRFAAREKVLSVEEQLFYHQLLRMLNQYNRIQELSLEHDRMQIEESLYGESTDSGGDSSDDPPDSLGTEEPG